MASGIGKDLADERQRLFQHAALLLVEMRTSAFSLCNRFLSFDAVPQLSPVAKAFAWGSQSLQSTAETVHSTA